MYTLGVLSKDPKRVQVTQDIITVAGDPNTQYLPSNVYTRVDSRAKFYGTISWLVDVSKEVVDEITLPKEYAWEVSNHVASMKRLIVGRVCPNSTVAEVEARLVTIRKKAVRSAFQAGPIGAATSSSNIYQGRPYRTFTGEDDRNTTGQQRDRMMSDGYRNQTFIRPGRKSNSSAAAIRKMDKLNRNERDLSQADRDISKARRVMGDTYTALQMNPSKNALLLFARYRNSITNMQKKREAIAACMFSALKSTEIPLKQITGGSFQPSLHAKRIFVVVNSNDPVLRVPWGMMFDDPPRKRPPAAPASSAASAPPLSRSRKRKREPMSRNFGVPVYY